jgi:hypothetical protein
VVPFHTLEVVHNGRVVAAERADGGTHRCTLRRSVRVERSGWIAVRCTSRVGRWIGAFEWAGQPAPVAAHSSPVYVVAGDEEPFVPSEARYMLTLLDVGLTWLETLAIPADAARHARARLGFERARAQLHGRLRAHGGGS